MIRTLQQKNTQYLFTRLLIVMVIVSVLFYFLMRAHALHSQRKQLELSQLHIWKAFSQSSGTMPPEVSGEYTIDEKNKISQDLLNQPRDTVLFYPGEDRKYPSKMLTGEYSLIGKRYQLTTYTSSTEINHLIIKVFLTEAVILGLLFFSVIYINRRTSGRLWLPFRSTMKKLNEYDINRQPDFELAEQTGIREFNELNAALTALLQKVNQAYTNQKHFVENASHEIQTPLAVIRSKLELLIDQPGMTEEVASLLLDITVANERLSLMNKNLLLLSKIENNQFPSKSPVNLAILTEQVIQQYEEYYEEGFPEVITNIHHQASVIANPSLMEILIQNLVRNAIIHNIPSGFIKVELDAHSLKITNSGPVISVDPGSLFERFKKGNDETRSTGLGLALVKQITQLYDFKITYSYTDQNHELTLSF